MKSMRTGWLSHSIVLAAAVMVAWVASPAWAGYELPPGERITNLPHIPRSMPQKEAYENYDPTIGRNFDIKNFWMRADLRVRPEFRNGVCFGGGAPVGGACNSNNVSGVGAGAPNPNAGKAANDFYVQQWVRLGIGYDLSPDVNFYFELIDSATWGGNGSSANAGNGGDPLTHNCGQPVGGQTANTTTGAVTQAGQANCRLGVRAAYVLVRNLGGVQGLSMKAGRQYVIFGNHSLFGHFDWANTGYSHDGIMFSYQTKNVDSYLGWFRNSETDLTQGTAVGSGAGNIITTTNRDGSADVDMFIFYNQIKSVPGFLIEPYYVLYINNLPAGVNQGQGLGTAKLNNQIRHMIGNRFEMRKGGWDVINETAWQMGRTGVNTTGASSNTAVFLSGTNAASDRNLTINAWATRNWIGYTWYDNKMKPRLAFNVDYASGDGNANCTQTGAQQKCKSANTFENFFPTNHIHMGYADVIAWKNMFAPQINFQMRPTERDHIEIWYMDMNLANKRDNWYRAGQGVYIWSKANNTKSHIGDEVDFTWTRMFADGKVAFQTTYGHIFTGGYIQQNLGASSNQSWGFVQLWMNF
ncbi:MAG: alginate export family protein [Nitrospiraceae bacterium]